jgi:EmrB/QacA subfamily drug resistance transporter
MRKGRVKASLVKNSEHHKWWILIAVATGSIMVAIDLSILMTCLPQLAKVFHTDSSVIGWLNIVYFIMTQSLMLTLGKVGDAKGRKKVFVAGLAFYTLGLLVASLSQGIGQLIAARVLQGAAGATITALGLAITVAAFKSDERGKALGILLGCASIGLVVGPMLGGIILDLLGWRAIFYTRIPFMAVSLVMAWIVIDEQTKADSKEFTFDALGAVTLFCWLACLLLFLSFGNKWGITSIPSLFLATATAVFFIVFLLRERRAIEPILELSIFRKRLFSIAVITGMASTIGSSSAVILVPFFLIQGLGLSATTVGTYMALLAAPSLVLSPVSGRLSDKMGSTFLSTAGVTIVCASLVWFFFLTGAATPLDVGIGILLLGTGIGIFHPPNNSALIGSVPKDMLGVASAVGTAARHVGSSIAFAVCGALYSRHELSHLGQLQQQGVGLATAKKMASVASFGDTLLFAVIITSIGVIASLFRGPGEPTTK